MNLDHRLQKARQTEQMLELANVTYRRFRAVDGREYLKNSSLPLGQAFSNLTKSTNKLSAGQIGCWLSYFSLFKEIAESETNQPTLILEDDADLETDFYPTIANTIQRLPQNWDILLCGYCCLTKYRERHLTAFVSRLTTRVKKFATTHCMVIRNSTTARNIWARLGDSGLEQPIDMFLHDLTLKRILKVYAFQPPVSVQRRDLLKSDISGSVDFFSPRLKNSLRDRLVLDEDDFYLN